MARAKQTARAEARRRARLASRPVEPASDVADDDAEGGDRESRAGDVRATASRAPGARRPILQQLFGSFRTAYRRPNVREDLVAWRSIVLSPALIGAAALIVAGGAAFLLYPGYSGSSLAFQYFVAPPPVGAVFVAGFFAKRASYLMGILLAIVDVAVLFALSARGLVPFAFVPYAVLLIPLNAVFAAGVAWYRRFLSSTSPRRAAQSRTTNTSGRGRAPAKPARRR